MFFYTIMELANKVHETLLAHIGSIPVNESRRYILVDFSVNIAIYTSDGMLVIVFRCINVIIARYNDRIIMLKLACDECTLIDGELIQGEKNYAIRIIGDYPILRVVYIDPYFEPILGLLYSNRSSFIYRQVIGPPSEALYGVYYWLPVLSMIRRGDTWLRVSESRVMIFTDDTVIISCDGSQSYVYIRDNKIANFTLGYDGGVIYHVGISKDRARMILADRFPMIANMLKNAICQN